jgi:hypothetical protein
MGLARDSVIGAVIDPEKAPVAVVPPIPGSVIRAVRAVALDSGRWGVTFAEVAPDTPHTGTALVRALWFGVYDGAAWHGMERLPMPDRGVPRVGLASALVRAGGSFMIAIPLDSVAHEAGVVVFRRDRMGWHTAVMELRQASYVALAVDSTANALLGIVSIDPRLSFDHNSLFLYLQSGSEAWRPLGRVLSGIGQPMHWPNFTVDRDHVVLSWSAMAQTADGARSEGRVANVSWSGKIGTVTVLDTITAQLLPVGVPEAGVLLLLDHVVTSQRRTLRAFYSDDDVPRELGALRNPFDGRFGAVMTSATSALLAGPRRGASSTDPTVATRLVHLRLRCHEGVRRGASRARNDSGSGVDSFQEVDDAHGTHVGVPWRDSLARAGMR